MGKQCSVALMRDQPGGSFRSRKRANANMELLRCASCAEIAAASDRALAGLGERRSPTLGTGNDKTSPSRSHPFRPLELRDFACGLRWHFRVRCSGRPAAAPLPTRSAARTATAATAAAATAATATATASGRALDRCPSRLPCRNQFQFRSCWDAAERGCARRRVRRLEQRGASAGRDDTFAERGHFRGQRWRRPGDRGDLHVHGTGRVTNGLAATVSPRASCSVAARRSR